MSARLQLARHRPVDELEVLDADKENYAEYYERCLSLLRVGGLVAVDNALWSGDVADPESV